MFVLHVRAAAARRRSCPTGVQNIAESAVDFVHNGIIMQTMGPDGLGYTPFLLTLFIFIFLCNIWEIIPVVQMPANARIALPAVPGPRWSGSSTTSSASSKQGLVDYFKNIMFPPGVPKAALHPA